MGPGIIKLKNPSILRVLMERKYHPTLIDIQCFIAEKYGLVITEGYRPKKHSGDVHSTNPVRANDNRVWCYIPQNLAYKIKDAVNNKWAYDPERPDMECVIIHDSGQGVHFHVQVHNRTQFR